MPYLVDSNVVIDHLGEVPEASQFLDQFAQDGIVISIVTYMEAFQGVVQSEHPEEAAEKFHVFADKGLFSPSPLP